MQSKLKSVVRFDSMPMPRAYFTPEGFLKDRPILTSCGIFEYTNPDGSVRRELRLPEDVFSPESLRSYRGKPVVITHEAGLIDKNNVAENQIGTILSEGERSGDDVKAEIIIHDTDAMRSAGLKELSLGYNLDLDETPGIWNGQRYDAIQRNIRINHLALVREARAGEQARLNLDGRDQVNLLKGGKRMSKKNKRVPHADAVLSDEELDKALEEYDKKYGNAEPEAQADAEDEEVVEKVEETVEPAPSDDVDEKVELVKARRDKRDEEGDPEDVDAAMGMIAHQDEDIQSLLDIIDTLRARLDLGAAKTDADDVEEEEVVVEEEPAEEEVKEDEVDDLEKLKGDSEDEELEEEEPAEDEEFEEDAEDDEDLPEGEEVVVEEEELKEDAEDEEEELPDEEDFEEDGCDDLGEKRMNADSVDRLVNMKIALGELGNKVGLRGLSRKPVKEAKLAIIKATLPNARLDGKSDVYVNEAFKLARDTIRNRSKKTTADQKKQMYNKKSVNMDSADVGGSMAVRDRMIAKYSNRNK